MQQMIIDELHVQKEIEIKTDIQRRIAFLKQYLLKTNANGYVLGISGGQDSTLAGKLAQLAVNELNEEQDKKKYTFIAIQLPYGEQFDATDAQDAVDFIQPNKQYKINIKDAVDRSVQSVESAINGQLSDFNKGNAKARERMIIQYDVAAHFGCLVIGTDHAAEALTGFYTKHGDGACDLEPLVGLTKEQGKQMLIHLKTPVHLYEKIPTADLEDNKPGLPDEEALGMSYELIDRYLLGESVAEHERIKIENQYRKTAHKRHQPANPFNHWWK